MNPTTRPFLSTSLALAASLALTLSALAQPTPSSAGSSTGPVPMRDPHAAPVPTLTPGTASGPTITPGMPSGPTMPFPPGASPFAPNMNVLPKYLEGAITLEEYQALMKFQQQVNDDAESKELMAKIAALTQQARQAQSELSKHRMKALADNAEMKAIAEKMEAAMRAHPMGPFMGPSTSPANGPHPTAPMPGGPTPTPTPVKP